MRDDGVGRALCLVTSAYSSYSGCRQYREDLARAREQVGEGAPELDKVRVYYNHPGFVEPQVDLVAEALAQLPEDQPRRRARGLHHPLDPDDHVPPQRLRGAAPRGLPARHGGRPRTRVGAGLQLAVRPARGPVADPGRQRPPRGTGARRRCPGGGRRPHRVRVRPHGGRLRPRRRGAGDRGPARSVVRPGRHRRRRPPFRGRARRARARAPRWTHRAARSGRVARTGTPARWTAAACRGSRRSRPSPRRPRPPHAPARGPASSLVEGAERPGQPVGSVPDPRPRVRSRRPGVHRSHVDDQPVQQRQLVAANLAPDLGDQRIVVVARWVHDPAPWWRTGPPTRVCHGPSDTASVRGPGDGPEPGGSVRPMDLLLLRHAQPCGPTTGSPAPTPD